MEALRLLVGAEGGAKRREERMLGFLSCHGYTSDDIRQARVDLPGNPSLDRQPPPHLHCIHHTETGMKSGTIQGKADHSTGAGAGAGAGSKITTAPRLALAPSTGADTHAPGLPSLLIAIISGGSNETLSHARFRPMVNVHANKERASNRDACYDTYGNSDLVFVTGESVPAGAQRVQLDSKYETGGRDGLPYKVR